MAEIVNLRMARKAKARTEAESQAKENRTRFSQSRNSREKHRVDTERDARSLDGAKRDE